MVTDCTHGPSCGAPVDPIARSCAYCGVPYPRKRETERHDIRAIATDMLIAEGLRRGFMTTNEARAIYGLPPVK